MKIDIHTHVLPGVDHGAGDWDMSLEMLAESVASGVKAVIATPHYLPWKEGVTADIICERCGKAKERLRRVYGIKMDIYPGNEIYYSSETVKSLKSGKALTLAGSEYVLVEFGPEVSYQVLCSAASDLRFHGYIPVFAHIERYQCLEQGDKLLQLKEMGVLFQVNMTSFQGGFFDGRTRRIKRWLKEQCIDFIASDMHDLTERPPMSVECLKWLQKTLDSGYQDKLLYGNAQDMILKIKE